MHYIRGSAISKIIGLNAKDSSNFDTTVNMWVFEEMIEGEKLSEIINTRHENVKYLPGEKLPENVVTSANATNGSYLMTPVSLGCCH